MSEKLGRISVTTIIVSILVRTRDRAGLLREALASVAAQTQVGIELLVVNDGGQPVGDVVAEQARGAVVAHRYVDCMPGKGRSHAANRLLEMARGTYLMFLDDDDWWLPTHVARLVAALDAQPQKVAAYADVSCVRRDAAGEYVEVSRFESDYDALRLGYESFLPIHAVLFRRAVVEAGCRFDEALDAYEDWGFWLQVARLGEMCRVPGVSAVYRLDSGAGFGCPESAQAISRERLLAFVRSARAHWSDAQLVAMLGLLGHKYRADGLETALSAARGELAAAQGERAQLARALALCRDEIEGMRRSRSWRITRPLRWLSGRLRGGGA